MSARVSLALLVLSALASSPARAADEAPVFEPVSVLNACKGGVIDLDDVISRVSSGKQFSGALFAPEASYSPRIDDLLLCQTLAGRAPSCKGVPARDVFCREEAAYVRFVFAAFKGKDAVEKCKQSIPRDAGIPPGAAERLCALLADGLKRGQSPAEVCAKAVATGLPGGQPSCEADLAYMLADPRRCPATPQDKNQSQELCRRRAALVAALRGDGCASLPLCVALETGGASACGQYRDDAARALCADIGTFAKLAESAGSPMAPTLEQRKAQDPVETVKQTKKRRAEDDAKATAALRDAALKKVEEKEAKRKEADLERASRPVFKEGQPMENTPADVLKRMKEIEEKGRQPQRKTE